MSLNYIDKLLNRNSRLSTCVEDDGVIIGNVRSWLELYSDQKENRMIKYTVNVEMDGTEYWYLNGSP